MNGPSRVCAWLVGASLLSSCASGTVLRQGPPPAMGPAPQMGLAPAPHTPGMGLLKADAGCGSSGTWAPITITNASWDRSAWVTFYENTSGGFFGDGPPIVYAWCWLPGETRMACVEKRNYIIRAEMLGPPGWLQAAKDCSLGKSCDTNGDSRTPDGARIDMGPGNARAITIKDYDWGCNWDPRN